MRKGEKECVWERGGNRVLGGGIKVAKRKERN